MSFLRNLQYAFFRQGKNLLRDNEKFKNIHKGETCFILGNGFSLKYYDLSVLSNLATIGCSYSLTDKRLIGSGLNYCVFTSSYLMFPLWRNRRSGKIQLNSLSPIFKKIIKENSRTHFFINLTDRYAFLRQPKNISYFYHFGEKKGYSYDISNCFSLMSGALDAMLGTAKYLGFSKVVLLGCDYLGSPLNHGHFYTNEVPLEDKVFHDYNAKYAKRFKKIADNLALDVLTIFPEGVSSPDFKSKTFSEYFAVDEKYHNQSQIIDSKYWKLMQTASSKRQIFFR